MQKIIKMSLVIGALSSSSALAGPWAHGFFGGTIGFNQTEVVNTDLSGYNGVGTIIQYDAGKLNFGAHVGKNYDLQPNWYWGWELGLFSGPLEGDGQYLPFVGDPTRVDDSIASIKSSGMLRAVARIGYAQNQTSLFYGLGGLTAVKASAEFNDVNPNGLLAPHTSGGSATLVAPTIGVGYEHRFAGSDEWIGRIEASHTFFDDVLASDSSSNLFEHEIKPMTSIRIGLSKMF